MLIPDTHHINKTQKQNFTHTSSVACKQIFKKLASRLNRIFSQTILFYKQKRGKPVFYAHDLLKYHFVESHF